MQNHTNSGILTKIMFLVVPSRFGAPAGSEDMAYQIIQKGLQSTKIWDNSVQFL